MAHRLREATKATPAVGASGPTEEELLATVDVQKHGSDAPMETIVHYVRSKARTG